MKNTRGFTLTEILLAVMIVGIIGIALASLSTASMREAKVGRTKTMLRNNISVALRQLRQDIHEASYVQYVQGPQTGAGNLLILKKGVDSTGADHTIVTQGLPSSTTVTYSFTAGGVTSTLDGESVQPSGANDGGIIYRNGAPWLRNVKYIPYTVTINGTEVHYPSPLFTLRQFSGFNSPNTTNYYAYNQAAGYCNTDASTYNATYCAALQQHMAAEIVVRIVVELPTSPVVNDVIEERFVLPLGLN